MATARSALEHSTGQAGRSNNAAAQSRLAAHGARRCEQQAGCVGAPGRAPAENVRRSRLARRCPRPGVGVRADHTGSQNATRRAKEKVTARNYISRQNTMVQESVQWVPWPGPRPGSERRPVGGRFRQPDRTPFFRPTPAFGLRSLRKYGYVPGQNATGLVFLGSSAVL